MGDVTKNVETKQNLADAAVSMSDELRYTDEDVVKKQKQYRYWLIATSAMVVVTILVLVARVIYA